jgi:hypothetical protein
MIFGAKYVLPLGAVTAKIGKVASSVSNPRSRRRRRIYQVT